MIKERWKFAVRDGLHEEMIKLLQAERDRTGEIEIYQCSFGGQQSRFAVERGFGSLAELETFWAEYGSSPEGQEFVAGFRALANNNLHGTHEIWEVL
jgi:hypothetical protein